MPGADQTHLHYRKSRWMLRADEIDAAALLEGLELPGAGAGC